MKIKCRYCESLIEDSGAICPQCGATNLDMKRAEEVDPKTIEELQEFCKSKNIPAESMRFFIGVNYKSPRAFGIYRDGDKVIVYKNKSDGSRAIRYEGKDEAYAVAQIHQKMKEEIAKRKASSRSYQLQGRNIIGDAPRPSRSRRSSNSLGALIRVIIIAQIILVLCQVLVSVMATNRHTSSSNWYSNNGYYEYDNDYYYRSGDNWYKYDSILNNWYYESDFDYTDYASSIPYSSFYNDYGDNGYSIYDYDYYYGNNNNSSYDYNSNNDTSWDYDWSSNDDWSYDWDSGWDSWDTDWDSDW